MSSVITHRMYECMNSVVDRPERNEPNWCPRETSKSPPSYKRHCVSNKLQIEFRDTLFMITIKKNINASHHGPFVRGIHRWPMGSFLERLVPWDAFPCYDFDVNPIVLQTDSLTELLSTHLPILGLSNKKNKKTWFQRDHEISDSHIYHWINNDIVWTAAIVLTRTVKYTTKCR